MPMLTDRLRGLVERARGAGTPAAVAVLVAGMVIAAAMILVWAGDRIFAIDEWEYVVGRRGWDPETFLRPINGHLLALPLVIYKTFLAAFGGTSHLPLTLLSIALHLGVVALLYAIAARRLGPWWGLVPAFAILYLGSGWEVMLNTAAMQNQVGIIAGLGAFLSLDRLGRRGDALTALLLVCSLASFTIGLAFTVGVAAWILLERVPGSSWRRIWVFAAPLALYVVWFAWARQFHQDSASGSALVALGSGVVDQLSSIAGGITGLYRQASGTTGGGERSDALAFVIVGLVVWGAVSGPRPTPSQGAALVTLAAYLTLVALGLSEIRPPQSSRYIYMGSLLLMVVAAELWPRGVRLRPGWLAVAAVAAGLALMSNVAGIKGGGDFFEDESAYNRAELGALELARDEVDPSFVPEAVPFPAGADPPHQDLGFTAGAYFDAIDEFGSPADSEAELATEPAAARDEADRISAAALPISLTDAPEHVTGTTAPQVVNSANADVSEHGGCVLIDPQSDAAPAGVVLTVPDGDLTFGGSAKPPLVALGRFADDLPVELTPTGPSGSIVIPGDAATRPWHAGFQFTAPAKVCG
jgi:hypothetical protein